MIISEKEVTPFALNTAKVNTAIKDFLIVEPSNSKEIQEHFLNTKHSLLRLIHFAMSSNEVVEVYTDLERSNLLYDTVRLNKLLDDLLKAVEFDLNH
jgi:hypothetical protein